MWTLETSPGLSETEISLLWEQVEHLVCLKQRYHCPVNMWNPGVPEIKISHHVNTWKIWFVWNRDITVMWTHGTQEYPKQRHHVMWTLGTSPGLSETDITDTWTLGTSQSGFSKTGTCHANTFNLVCLKQGHHMNTWNICFVWNRDNMPYEHLEQSWFANESMSSDSPKSRSANESVSSHSPKSRFANESTSSALIPHAWVLKWHHSLVMHTGRGQSLLLPYY